MLGLSGSFVMAPTDRGTLLSFRGRAMVTTGSIQVMQRCILATHGLQGGEP